MGNTMLGKKPRSKSKKVLAEEAKLNPVVVCEKYIPTPESLKFISFVRATNNESNVSPDAHYEISDAMFSSEKSDRRLLIEWQLAI